MGQTVAGHFTCEACGKSYRWKPELAGRKAKCKCGAVMVCPQEEPGGVEDDLFELAPDPVAARPNVPPQVVAAAVPLRADATHSANLIRAAKPLEYGADSSAVDKTFPNKTLDLFAPLWLIAGSVVIEVVAIELNPGFKILTFPAAMMSVGIGMTVGTVLVLIGIFLAARVRQINLGSFPSALLKLMAIAIAPSAAMDLLWVPLRFLPILGILLDWLGGFILYFALIGVFFELDQSDTWYCVMVILLVKIAIAIVIAAGVVAMLMHH